MSGQTAEEGLISMLERGGVFYNLSGSRPDEVITDLVQTVPLPKGLDQKILLKAILEREALMPTAVGNGIAIPHPRSPLITESADQLIAIGFPEKPIEWQALDGESVSSLILILSASPKLHLKTLSKISFLCQQEDFHALLANRASAEEIIEAIRRAEETWV